MCEPPTLGSALFLGTQGPLSPHFCQGSREGVLTLGSGFQHRDLQSSIVSPVYPITPSFLGGKQRTPAGLQEPSPAKGASINQSPW